MYFGDKAYLLPGLISRKVLNPDGLKVGIPHCCTRKIYASYIRKRAAVYRGKKGRFCFLFVTLSLQQYDVCPCILQPLC